MSNMYAEETEFARELIKILSRQYSRHHFDGIVQYFVDQALGRSGYTLSLSQDDAQACAWTYRPEQYGTGDYWETGCGNAFQIASGTPAENGFRFCPYCGKRLEEK